MSNVPRNDGYGRYQGRKGSGVKTFLKSVIVALVILLVLLLAAVIFLKDYLVYTDDGVKLTLPWAENADKDKDEKPSAGQPSVPIIIEGDGAENGDVETEEPSESPQPELSGPLHAVLVSQTELMAGSAAEQVTLAG